MKERYYRAYILNDFPNQDEEDRINEMLGCRTAYAYDFYSEEDGAKPIVVLCIPKDVSTKKVKLLPLALGSLARREVKLFDPEAAYIYRMRKKDKLDGIYVFRPKKPIDYENR